MNTIALWKDALKFFKPSSFKLFFLVTLKFMYDALRIWIVYFGWLFILQLMLQPGNRSLLKLYILPTVLYEYLLQYSYPVMFLIAVIQAGAFILAARPSLGIKNCAYFRKYLALSLPIIVLFCCANAALILLSFGGLVTFVFCKLFLILYVSLIAFFYSDLKAKPSVFFVSMKKALCMLWYNLPIFLITIILFSALLLSSYFIMLLSMSLFNLKFFSMSSLLLFFALIDGIINKLFIPLFMVCFLMNIYIKRLHDNSGLYFPQP